MGDEARYTTRSGFVAEVGTVLNEKLKLLEYIGKGASARVWRAHHILGRFDVAVKLINASKYDFDRGCREFNRLSQLFHPNVVRTFQMELIEGHDQAFMTMEYIDGRSLDRFIVDWGGISAEVIVTWLRQLVGVLAYLHPMRTIHRDIKPNNIVIDESRFDPRAVLIDFNISHLTDAEGTLAYKCPSVEATGEWSPYADLWALAVSFYEVVTCAELFERRASYEVQLDQSCPAGFPANTFDALRAIIHGAGQDTPPEEYLSLFGVDQIEAPTGLLSDGLAKAFGITSRNQRFLVESMLGSPDPRKPRSKNVIARAALHEAGRPAAGTAVKKLRAVFSQLKAKNAVRYTGKANAKAVLTDDLLDAVAAETDL